MTGKYTDDWIVDTIWRTGYTAATEKVRVMRDEYEQRIAELEAELSKTIYDSAYEIHALEAELAAADQACACLEAVTGRAFLRVVGAVDSATGAIKYDAVDIL